MTKIPSHETLRSLNPSWLGEQRREHITTMRSGFAGERSTWIKVKNRAYSQAEGRHQLFDNRRGTRMVSAAAR